MFGECLGMLGHAWAFGSCHVVPLSQVVGFLVDGIMWSKVFCCHVPVLL